MSTSGSEREAGRREQAAAGSKEELQGILWQMRADLERMVAEAGPSRIEEPGVTGDWSLKDVIAHLSGWRWWSVARMEGAVRNQEPAPPWSADLDEGKMEDVHRINQQFYAANHSRSVADVLADSRATFDRLERALLALPEEDLFTPGHFPWLHGYAAADIVLGSAGHLYEEHEPEIDAFIGRSTPR